MECCGRKSRTERCRTLPSLEKKNRSTLKHRIRLDFPRLENFKVPTNFDGRRASVGQQVYHVELIRNVNIVLITPPLPPKH